MTPPRVACWLLETALPGTGEAIAGDLCEEYREHVLPARGKTVAHWWFRWQVARSLAPLFFRSWQRASVLDASAAMAGAGVAAAVPATLLLMLRTFVLQQVPLKTTTDMSAAFVILLTSLVVATTVMGVLGAMRALARR